MFYIALLSVLWVTIYPVAASAPGDIQFQREGDNSADGPYPPSVFPHWVHRVNYRCDACHDGIFEMKSGATPVSMELMAQGEVCGACHNGQLAFDTTFENCGKCHYAPDD